LATHKNNKANLDMTTTTLNQSDYMRLVTAKLGLKARKNGMMITRGATTKVLFAIISEYTLMTYKNSQIDLAIEHCERICSAMRGEALPVTEAV
jgi:hypothetical protein